MAHDPPKVWRVNDLIRNGLIWLVGAAVFCVLWLAVGGEQIGFAFRLVAIWLFLIAAVQIVRGLLSDRA